MYLFKVRFSSNVSKRMYFNRLATEADTGIQLAFINADLVQAHENTIPHFSLNFCLKTVIFEPGMAVHVCNVSTWEMGEGSAVQGHSQLQTEFEASEPREPCI